MLQAIEAFQTEEFVAQEIEKNRIAANKRMEEHLRRANRESRR